MTHPVSNARDIVIATTYKCNSQCITCNICRIQPPDDLNYKYYKNLPANLKNIGISGGESTLRDDLVDLIDIVSARCKKAKLTLSTNGLLVEKIEAKMRAIYKIDRTIGIAVSIDGLFETNDRVRGVPNSFQLAVNAIKVLKSIGFNDLRIAFNICNENIQELHKVYQLAKDLRVAFTCSLAQNSVNYFQKTDNLFTETDLLKEKLNAIIKNELNSTMPKKWVMSYYDYGLYYLHTYKKRLLKCGALQDFFFIDPRGDVYPCIFRTEIVGNLKDYYDFSELWFSKKATQVRKDIQSCSKACWQLCTVRTCILNNIFPVSLWILRKKILALLGPNII